MDGARAEHEKWLELAAGSQIDPPRDLVAIDLAVRPVVNLSDPAVRGELEVARDVITRDRDRDREACRRVKSRDVAPFVA